MAPRTAADAARLYEQTLAAEYASWIDHWAARHPGCGFIATRLSGSAEAPAAVIAGPGHALVNETLGIGFDDAEPEELVAAVERAFQHARSAFALAELSPYATPGLAAAFAARGFLYTSSLHVFVLDAEAGQPSLPHDPRVDVHAIDKADPVQVEAAARLIASAKTNRQPTDPQDLDALTIARQVCACPRVKTFIASVDGVPAGGASAGLHEGHPLSPRHLNLYGAGTLPHARRLGVQRALLAARLRFGRDLRMTSASLDCRPGLATERTAPALGFRLVYTKPVLTKRLPAPPSTINPEPG